MSYGKGTTGFLCEAFDDLNFNRIPEYKHNNYPGYAWDYPVLFSLNVREWDGEFLFNPKRVVPGPERTLIELSNGHCVTKTLRKFYILLKEAPRSFLDIRITDKNRSIMLKSPELAVEYVYEEMLVKITRCD